MLIRTHIPGHKGGTCDKIAGCFGPFISGSLGDQCCYAASRKFRVGVQIAFSLPCRAGAETR